MVLGVVLVPCARPVDVWVVCSPSGVRSPLYDRVSDATLQSDIHRRSAVEPSRKRRNEFARVYPRAHAVGPWPAAAASRMR